MNETDRTGLFHIRINQLTIPKETEIQQLHSNEIKTVKNIDIQKGDEIEINI